MIDAAASADRALKANMEVKMMSPPWSNFSKPHSILSLITAHSDLCAREDKDTGNPLIAGCGLQHLHVTHMHRVERPREGEHAAGDVEPAAVHDDLLHRRVEEEGPGRRAEGEEPRPEESEEAPSWNNRLNNFQKLILVKCNGIQCSYRICCNFCILLSIFILIL
mgnify:CR=1 FL=1